MPGRLGGEEMCRKRSCAAAHEAAGGSFDSGRVDAEMGVEVVDSASLAEMFDAQRDGAMAEDAAEPAKGGGVGVD